MILTTKFFWNQIQLCKSLMSDSMLKKVKNLSQNSNIVSAHKINLLEVVFLVLASLAVYLY